MLQFGWSPLNYDYNYNYSLWVFTPVLAGGLSLEFEWQQVSLGFQDSSQYSSRSQQCWSLKGLPSSSDFQFLQSFFQAFDDCFKHIIYNWYHCYPHIPLFFSSLAGSRYLFVLLLSFIFTLWLSECQNRLDGKFFFSCKLTLALVFWLWLRDLFVSQNSREFYGSHSLIRIMVSSYIIR